MRRFKTARASRGRLGRRPNSALLPSEGSGEDPIWPESIGTSSGDDSSRPKLLDRGFGGDSRRRHLVEKDLGGDSRRPARAETQRVLLERGLVRRLNASPTTKTKTAIAEHSVRDSIVAWVRQMTMLVIFLRRTMVGWASRFRSSGTRPRWGLNPSWGNPWSVSPVLLVARRTRSRSSSRSGPRWRALRRRARCGPLVRRFFRGLLLRQHFDALMAGRPRPLGSPAGRRLRARGAPVPFWPRPGPQRSKVRRRRSSSKSFGSPDGTHHAQHRVPRA